MQLLPFLDLHFTLRVRGPAPDLPFLGPTVRGLLGYGLRQVCCGHDPSASGACSMGENCTYAYLFEGPVHHRIARRGIELDALPQPFLPLVAPPGASEQMVAGPCTQDPQRVRFGIRLIGNACDLRARVVDAIEARAAFGFGARSIGYSVESVAMRPGEPLVGRDHALPVSSADDPARARHHPASDSTRKPLAEGSRASLVRFHFDAPMSIGGRTGDSPRSIGSAIVDAAARRLWLLEAAYGAGLPERSVPRSADPSGFDLRESRLTAWSMSRRSTRHGRVVRLCGVQGSVLVAGQWDKYARLLTAAEHYGIGRNITFGFGRLRVEKVAEIAPASREGDVRSNSARERVPRWIRLRGHGGRRPTAGPSDTTGERRNGV